MEFRRSWLIGVAACVAAHTFAQESAPVQPATDAKSDATATSASPLEGELDAEKIMAAQRAGYKIRNENGQTLLCRRELQTGSRVRYNTSCLTPRQWAQLEEDTKLQLKTMERKPMNTGSR